MTDANHATAARRAQAEADIAAVEQQRLDGELNDPTADRLIERYRRELAALDETPDAESSPVRPSRRLVGTILLVGALIAVSALAFASIRPRDGGLLTGDLGGGVDLDSVSNEAMEAVIAANPDVAEVAAMRVALADRYFDAGEFGSALTHYLEALDGQLDTTRRARSLARIGWMSFVSGRADLAESYLGEALEADPGYDESRLFLGLVLFNRGQAAEALTYLEPLLDNADIPESLRADVVATVEAARAQVEGAGE